MANTAHDGKPYAVNPHVRFDEGETASAKPLYKKWIACLMLVAGMGAGAVTLSPVNLVTTYGVKDGDGKLVVLGPEGSWDGKHGKECVYDDDTSTFIDPTTEVDNAGNGWAGFETTFPVIPTRIRYAGRVGMESRAKGCLFQGANQADFSDAVTLHVANPPNGWTGSSYVDVTLPFDPAFRSFTYFRVWGPTQGGGDGNGMAGGNMAEVEFYGVNMIPSDASVPTKPVPAVMDTLNGHFNVRYTVPSGLLAVLCQRHLATDDADVWTDVVYPGWCPAAETVIFRDAAAQTVDCTYRLGYVNSAGTSDWCVVEAPLRSYARGTVLGTNPWPDLPTCTKDKVWDGDIRTFYTGFAANGCWTGLDLGEGFSGRLAAIRYVPRGTASYEITRMVGRFQTADNPDFTDAVDLYTIPSCPSSYCLTTVTLDDPPALGRYVRYLGANNSYGDASEIELELTTPMATPSNLAVTRSDLTNQFAVLTWTNDLTAPWETAQVQRATTASGPFEAIDSVTRGESRFVDETASVGIPYWYRVVYAVTVNDETVSGQPSNVVAYRRCRRLDRSWDDLTHLAEGLTLITVGKPWGGSSDNGSKCFDGSLSTYGDMDPESGAASTAVYCGIDFGTDNKAGIGFFRAISRQNHSYALGNISQTELWGADDPGSWQTERVKLGQVPTIAGYSWFEVAASSDTMSRYVYFNKTTGNFRAAFAEVEFYGWTLSDIADAVLPPTDLRLTEGIGPMLQVTWKAGVNASSYRVERQVNNGDWTVIEDAVTGTSYIDRDVNYTTGRYTYRVTAVNGTTEAVSATTVTKSLWQKGNGTGLHAVYRYPYTIYGDAAERVVYTCTNSIVNFTTWGTGSLVPGLPEATDNVGVTWSGRLIVPLEGDYQFSASVDDQLMIRIDGVPVVNTPATGGLMYGDIVPLTAGEHSIRVDYREGTGAAMAGIYWRGVVDEGGIPMSQFIPEELPALPEPWEGERTFGAVKFGWTRFTDATSFTIAGQGGDFYQANASGHFVWRRQKGDFDCSFRFTVNPSQVSSKIMVVARNANTATSPIFAGVLQPSLGATIKYRTPATSGIADMVGWNYSAKTSAGGWLRLERKGNVFNYYYRLNENADWTKVGSYTDANGDFAATQLVGVQVLAGFNNTNNTSLEPSEIAISDFVLKHEMPTMLIIR